MISFSNLQMCVRINNLHSLNMALEDIQQKIATRLGVYEEENEESETSNEHQRVERKGTYFS